MHQRRVHDGKPIDDYRKAKYRHDNAVFVLIFTWGGRGGQMRLFGFCDLIALWLIAAYFVDKHEYMQENEY